MFINTFKSTVDWCEENYAVNQFVAEFWNTITFFPILISAIYWRTSFPRLFIFDKSFHYIFWCLFLVSIGTALFHATLLYKYQLLDELPMLLLSAKYTSLLVSFRQIVVFNNNSNFKNFIEFFINCRYSLIYIIILSYFFSPQLQIILFHGSLKIYESIIVLLVLGIQNYIKNINLNNSNFSINSNFSEYKSKIAYHARLGLLSYFIAGLLWLLENLFCEYVQHLQYHAFWHIISSIGVYHLNCVISYCYLTNNLLYYLY
jgi:hypothetical protein